MKTRSAPPARVIVPLVIVPPFNRIDPLCPFSARVEPVLSRFPLRFIVVVPVRVSLLKPIPAVVNVPPMFKVAPFDNSTLPALDQFPLKLPMPPASAMLPMQGTLAEDRDWMLYAHRQHHMLVDALQQGNGARAAALAVEHTEVAQYNLRQALLKRNESEKVLPAMRLVVGR